MKGLAELLRHRRAGEHAYCCGVARMLHGFAAATRHWPEGAVHQEHFGPPERACTPPYAVSIASSGRTVSVAANQNDDAAMHRWLRQRNSAKKSGRQSIDKVTSVWAPKRWTTSNAGLGTHGGRRAGEGGL